MKKLKVHIFCINISNPANNFILNSKIDNKKSFNFEFINKCKHFKC